MKIPVRDRSQAVTFNITPLIDIVFLLVIFFLVASHFSKAEPTEQVQLPTATQVQQDAEVRKLVITILPDGSYFVGGNQVQLSDIEAMIADGATVHAKDYAVRIRSDKNTPHRFIQPIILACPKYGVTKFGFNVLESE